MEKAAALRLSVVVQWFVRSNQHCLTTTRVLSVWSFTSDSTFAPRCEYVDMFVSRSVSF